MIIDAHAGASTQDADDRFPDPPGGPGRLQRIGNDVVDLEHPRCRDRPTPDPLLDRILTEEERRWVEDDVPAEVRNVRVWALWAAKEAAFKVLSKLPGGPRVLRFQSFWGRLRLRPSDESARVRIDGWVQGPDPSVPVRVQGASDHRYLHLVSWNGIDARLKTGRLEMGLEGAAPEADAEALDALERRFTAEEWEGVHSVPSARVRLLARERLAAHLGGAGRVEILTSAERRGRTPPRIRVGGLDRPDLDVSLSHHGQYVAWAILLPPASGRGLEGASRPAP